MFCACEMWIRGVPQLQVIVGNVYIVVNNTWNMIDGLPLL